MKSSNKIFAILFFFLILSGRSFSQQIVNHHVDFASGSQNMWGPSWSAFSIDTEITLFDFPWNVSTAQSAITTVAGYEFGAGFDFAFSGVIGSKVSLEGFTTGTVEVDYPIDIVLDMNTDLLYDQGDQVAIKTDYTVASDYELRTFYPSAGEFKWDIYFQMAAEASATVCFFSCVTFPIIPQFDTGLQTINMATVSGNGASTGGVVGAWWLGAADPLGADGPGINGWPYSKPPQSPSFYTPSNPSGNPWIPWQCHVQAFPVTMDSPFGLSGELTIPYVPTTDALTGQNLSATGDSTYIVVQLEIFKLLGAILDFTPPPGPAVGLVLSNLSGSLDLGLAEIEWTVFTAYFEMAITNNQDFDFSPKVWGRFEFPVPVDYAIYDPVANTTSATSTSSIVNLELGKEIRYKYPCYFESIDITPTYSIDGTVDNFTNHTYDEIQFSFNMEAIAFSVTVPTVTVIPGFTIPSVCFPVPYPCPTWSNPFKWCSTTFCTPTIVIPPIGLPGFSTGFGPLYEDSIPIGPAIPYDWFLDSWNLEGFQDSTFTPFRMRANPLGISNSFTNVSCFGGADGAIDITTTAYNEATPLTYTWTNTATTQDLTNISAGPYEVSVIDANGCQMFTGATILEPEQPLSISYTKIDKNCSGGINDGSIDILVQGGTTGYSYNWSGPASYASNLEDITGLAAGTYAVTVTDSKNCTESISITISEPNILGQAGALTMVNCKNDADGEIAIDVFGGVLPYTYNWTGPVPYTNNIEDITGLSGGNYTLTITDGNNCTNTQTYTITEPVAVVSLTSTGVDVGCKYDSTGSIDVTTVGGTAGYVYQWINSQGVILPFQTEDLTNIPADNYTVTVTDNNGCQTQTTQLVAEPIASISSTPILTDILCFGNGTGVINPVINGGTLPYTYSWSDGSSAPIAINLVAGVYTLDITDGNLCTATYSFTLTEPDEALAISLSGTDILCSGENTGSVVSTVTGGTLAYSYNWSNGGTNSTISTLIAGPYSVIVTDNNGCTVTDNTILNEPLAPLSLSSTFIDVDCFGNNSGSIDLTIVGGTSPYVKVWSDGGSVVLSDTSEDISNLLADTYTILITDANGCIETMNTTVSQPNAPIAITGIVDDVNCFGLNDGGIDITVTGGTIGYVFNWSDGSITEDLTGIVAGNYTVTVTDNNSCTEMLSFDVIEPQAPLSIVTYPTDVLCTGGGDGSIESTVSGGTLPYVYSWSNGESTEDVINLMAGNYTLTITDGQGCISFSGAVVGQPALALNVAPTVTDVSCYGYGDGEILINITGGVQPYYFNWGNQNEILLNNPSETLTGLIIGDYFVRVKDKNGCIFEQIVTVNQPPLFEGSVVVSDVLCYGGASGVIDLSLIGGIQPYSIQWSNGPTTEDDFNLSSNTYTYVITDFNNCEIFADIFVDQPEPIKVSDESVPITCIDQTDAAIYINPYGGIMPYTFGWSNGELTQNVEGLAPGVYDVTITDDNGCIQVFNYEIYETEEECIGIPNTFTPNGDNYNDTWLIRNIDLYPNAMVKIFNKWGNEVYVSEGLYKPWDGLYNGNPLPSEVYFYIIELGNNVENNYTGTITIIR